MVMVRLYDHNEEPTLFIDLDHPVEHYEGLIRSTEAELAKAKAANNPAEQDSRDDAAHGLLVSVANVLGLVQRAMDLGPNNASAKFHEEVYGAILAMVMSEPSIRLHFSEYARKGYYIQCKMPEKPDRLPEIDWVSPEIDNA